jgi:2-polyprenyl-3-methyl-5-hydroxy-6-metoxy-1,4-benzoquinol methylase
MILSPLTGCSDVTVIKTIPSEKLIHDWKASFEIDITNELKNHREIHLCQCNKTRLKFFAPFDIAGSGKLYEHLQKLDGYYMSDKWEHQTAIRDLSDCKKILEIGSASGHFVKSCIDSGLDVRGIELNQAAVTAAKARNLPVERLDLREAADLYFESLDAVCSFQVLEHVPNPKDFIQWSIQMLKPGGKLIYCVPNSESFLKYQYNLLDLPPHHMLQWSEVAFKALEEIFPIRLEKVSFEPLASYHVSFYLATYSSHFRSFSRLSKLVFNRYTLPLYEKYLNLGLRKFLMGHSLYVQFRKV